MLRSQKPPTISMSLPRADAHKCSCPEEGQEVAAASTLTPKRTDPPPSKGVSTEELSLRKASEEWAASNEARRSPSQGGSRGSQRAAQAPVGKASMNITAQAMGFLQANLPTKLALVGRLAKS